VTAPVGWGFLGAGSIARAALAPAVHSADGAELVAAGARDIVRAAALGPSGAAYGSYDEVLADPRVEAVYIALANDDHLPWAERALAAGKHVLCEKPLGLTAAEVQTMAATARATDRLLVEASWNRWHPRTRRAEALLRSGAIGAVRRVEAGFTFAGVPEGNYRLDPARGGGALYDVGCYATAAALWATGFAPLEGVGATRRVARTGVDLTTDAVLSLGSAEAFVRCSIAEDSGQWLRVEGDGGTLALDGRAAFTSWLSPSSLTVTTSAGDRVEHFAPVDPYRVMVEHVSAAIRGAHGAWVLALEESVRIAEALDLIRAA
jgi:predicted dehydrogenase